MWCRPDEDEGAVLQAAADQGLDPQADAAHKIVAWLSAGTVKPGADGFAMLFLMLLALWLQIGGILLDGRSGALEKTAMKLLGTVKLVPGMPVEAFVQTGDRHVMSQLSRPLADQIARAFFEK